MTEAEDLKSKQQLYFQLTDGAEISANRVTHYPPFSACPVHPSQLGPTH